MANEQPLNAQQRAEILGSDWNPEWDTEAEQKWGDTEDWKLSQQQLAGMSARDFAAAKEQLDALEEQMAEALREGVAPISARAHELAEKHQQELSRWFPVSVEKQVLMARGYVADDRFRKHYDDRQSGLAQWIKDTIDSRAQALGIDPEQAQWI